MLLTLALVLLFVGCDKTCQDPDSSGDNADTLSERAFTLAIRGSGKSWETIGHGLCAGSSDRWSCSTHPEGEQWRGDWGVLDVSLGAFTVCSIDLEGRLSCRPFTSEEHPTGRQDLDVVRNAPSGLGFLAVEVGILNGCALRQSGAVCWGELVADFDGDFVDLAVSDAAAQGHPLQACFLQANGRVRCVGDGHDPDRVRWSGIKDLSLGLNHACLIDDKGKLSCELLEGSEPFEPLRGRYVEVAVADYAVCGIKDNGKIACAMIDEPVGMYQAEFTSCPPDQDDFIEIEAYRYTVCALRGNGRQWCWGGVNGITPP